MLQIIYNDFFYRFISQIKKRLYLKVLNDCLLIKKCDTILKINDNGILVRI